jgi:hypothetical protein
VGVSIAETEDVDAPEEGTDASDADTDAPDGEKPALADDEKATLPDDLADIAADVEAETALEEESDDGPQQTGDAVGDNDGSTDAPDALGDDRDTPEGPTWGDQYVTVLSVVLAAIVEEHGDEDADADPEEIAQLATQHPIALNESADRVFAEMQGTEQMDPKQALVVSTAVLCGTVLVQETDVASQAIGQLSNDGLSVPTGDAGGEAA